MDTEKPKSEVLEAVWKLYVMALANGERAIALGALRLYKEMCRE